jgi:transposase
MTNKPRYIEVDRTQTRWDFIDLDGMLPGDHRARIVWSFVESMDLSVLYAQINALEGEPGRPPPDPKVMLALWLYGTIEGVASARELCRLTHSDIAYRWLAGGVPLNYHGLSDFRVQHVDVLDRLLTESVTALIAEGLVSLADIALDGTKIRANAGRSSFKSETKLLQIEAAVERRVAALRAEIERDPEALSRRKRAAQQRAAREVKERAAQARAKLEQIRAEKGRREKRHRTDEAKKAEPTASLSDAEARNMRFPDGAVRPAFNAQIAAAPKQGIIVSVDMTDRRNDAGLAVPMVNDIARRYGKTPENLLLDTHYATAEDIAVLAEHPNGPVRVYAPPPTQREDVKPATLAKRAKARAREPESIQEWRRRMGTEAARTLYRLRKLIERINADRKNHGFGVLHVRGLIKAKAVALWHALANNLLAAHRLRTAL